MTDIDALNRILPQTQCRECGFAGCKPYAEAMLAGGADINLCPPGGVQTLQALAQALNKDASPHLAVMKAKTRAPALAQIDEAECIGCTKCIQACPVDAIFGAAKTMHVIIADLCTGCGLCVEPCPVDCIEMLTLEAPQYNRELALEMHAARAKRLEFEQAGKQRDYLKKRKIEKEEKESAERLAKQDYIKQALARVQAKMK